MQLSANAWIALFLGSHLLRDLPLTSSPTSSAQVFSAEIAELRQDILASHDLLSRVNQQALECDSRAWWTSLALKASLILDFVLLTLNFYLFVTRPLQRTTSRAALPAHDSSSSSDEFIPSKPTALPASSSTSSVTLKGKQGGKGPVRPSDLRTSSSQP